MAPADVATLDVLSNEPSSTTTTRSTKSNAPSTTDPMCCSSFQQGIQATDSTPSSANAENSLDSRFMVSTSQPEGNGYSSEIPQPCIGSLYLDLLMISSWPHAADRVEINCSVTAWETAVNLFSECLAFSLTAKMHRSCHSQLGSTYVRDTGRSISIRNVASLHVCYASLSQTSDQSLIFFSCI